MKKDQKRKQQLRQKTLNEALEFQAMFGARQKMGSVDKEVEDRLNEEILVFRNMGVADDFLMLKDIIDHIRIELGLSA